MQTHGSSKELPTPHPKASWVVLWLWYRTARGVEISYRQRVDLSCLLGEWMWEGSLSPPITELLWLIPLGWCSWRCGCSSHFCKISMILLVFTLRNVGFTFTTTEQFSWSLYLNSQACAQRPGTQWGERGAHDWERHREGTQHSRECHRWHSPSLPVTIVTLPWLPVRIKSEPHTELQLLLHSGHTSELYQAPNKCQAGPETTSASLWPQYHCSLEIRKEQVLLFFLFLNLNIFTHFWGKDFY